MDLYLEVLINGQSTQSIVSFRREGNALLASPKDLAELGIRMPDPAAAGLINLASLPGVDWRLDEIHQSIDLHVADSLRAPFAVGGRRSQPAVATTGTGLVLNYDAFAQHADVPGAGYSVAVSTEERWFGSAGVLTNTGVASETPASTRYVRQSSTYQYDLPSELTSVAAGDEITSSLSWSRPVRLGGFEVSRNFSLRPDLITFPVPQLGGSAALPSTVDLYVNNVHQVSSSVPSGPFVINGAGAITGAGMATLVVRDAMGRAVSATLPIYIDSRLLAAGLNSFSVEAGLLRYNYGVRSFDYEGNPALNASFRSGLSDQVTIEAHTEATANLENAGIGALFKIAQAGVLNASMTASSNSIDWAHRQTLDPNLPPANTLIGGVNTVTNYGIATRGTAAGNGAQVSLGYQLVTPLFSLAAQSMRVIGNYADLASVGGTPSPRLLDQLSLSVPVVHEQTVGTSFIHVNDSVAGRSTLASFWYSAHLGKRVGTYVNVSRDFEQSRSSSVSIGLSMTLGERTSSFSNAGSSDGRAVFGTSISHGADYSGGAEWAAQADRVDDATSILARAGYLGQYGELSAAVESFAGHSALSVEAVGSALWMDGVVEASRHINGGFALVSTDGTPGVPVLHENRKLGTTDDSGHLLVPDLNAYQHNSLAIDPLDLPPEDKIPVDRLDVTPRSLSGVLAKFPIEHYSAVTLTVVDRNGEYLPAGSVLTHVETGQRFTVGYEGMVFIEGVQEKNHLVLNEPAFICAVTFAYHAAATPNGSLKNLGRVVCQTQELARL